MNTVINGSICLTDLIDKCKAGHSAFTKGKNGKIYLNYTEWINDEPNQYGQHSSLLLNSHKDKKAEEGKVYIGNGKKGEYVAEAPNDNDKANLDISTAPVASGEPIDDLPF